MKLKNIITPAVKKNYIIIFAVITAAIIGALVGSFTTVSLLSSKKPAVKDLIDEYYQTENAVHVSPHSLRKKMDKGEDDYTLVDLRSSQEYEKEHIIGAINIPTYKDPDNEVWWIDNI